MARRDFRTPRNDAANKTFNLLPVQDVKLAWIERINSAFRHAFNRSPPKPRPTFLSLFGFFSVLLGFLHFLSRRLKRNTDHLPDKVADFVVAGEYSEFVTKIIMQKNIQQITKKQDFYNKEVITNKIVIIITSNNAASQFCTCA